MADTQGIRLRHGPRGPAYEASIFDPRRSDRYPRGRKIRKTFTGPGALAAAKQWRADALSARGKGTLPMQSRVTLRESAEAFLEGAEAGTIFTRSGDQYKPSVVRGYRTSLERHVLPDLGALRLVDVQRRHLQDVVDRMLARGANASTIRNAILPVRAIYRRALTRNEVNANPTMGLALPAVRGRRDRFASPAEAEQLLAALAAPERPLWATALYGGLRRGELMALRWEDVDLAGGRIRVERSWDIRAGVIETKSQAGNRKVPIPAVLRDHLDAHKLACTWDDGLVFGRTATRPFDPEGVQARADKAWKAASLARITLHECRHTFASLMIAAGVNAKALSVYMGHSSINITLDRYGHLMPGNEDEAAALLDAYLERANTQARLAQL